MMVWFQPHRMRRWLKAIAPDDYNDVKERALRFGEEALELLQVEGITAETAHALVDYVFSRPVGEREQEIAGVLLTLGGYFSTVPVSPFHCFEKEMARAEDPEVMAKIAAKHKMKPAKLRKRSANHSA